MQRHISETSQFRLLRKVFSHFWLQGEVGRFPRAQYNVQERVNNSSLRQGYYKNNNVTQNMNMNINVSRKKSNTNSVGSFCPLAIIEAV